MIRQRDFTIIMQDTSEKHGQRRWMIYKELMPVHAAPGDRFLDIDASATTEATKFVFRLGVDYDHDRIEFKVRFAEPPIVPGAGIGPDVSRVFGDIDRSSDGREAWFTFDPESVAEWQVAETMRKIGSPVLRVPFAFNFDDERLGFPGWMMPDPDSRVVRDQEGAGPLIWHGGPHPPINSFLVIPPGA